MTAGIVVLFLLAPLLVVPLGLRLIPADEDPLAQRLQAIACRASFPAGVLLALAFALPAGIGAAALAVPWLGVAGLAATGAVTGVLRDPVPPRPKIRHATDAARGFLLVGATFALTHRLGLRPFDFPATIILLTAIHFHFAGFVLPIAGALAFRRRPARSTAVALGVLIVGIPLTAVGFLGLSIAGWVGSMLVAAGSLAVGVATWLVAGRLATPTSRSLARIAALSLFVTKPMAVVYATGLVLGTTWLDLSTMARVHGTLNALGFAVPAMTAWMLDRRARRAGGAHGIGGVGVVIGAGEATTRRTGPATPLDVVWFNWPPFVFGPITAIVAGLAALGPLPTAVRIGLAIGAVAALVATTTAVMAIVWVFGFGTARRWRWVANAAHRPRTWLNLTTGFDDSTSTLRARLAGVTGLSVDIFDETAPLDPPQRRARGRFPPGDRTATVATLDGALGAALPQTAFLLMSAHEVPGADRVRLFTTIADRLLPGGRLIVVEHLRDLPNAIAFGLGARHFQSRATWLEAGRLAGLEPVEEHRLSPFVRGFVFGKVVR
jgi:hypothetical protein